MEKSFSLKEKQMKKEIRKLKKGIRKLKKAVALATEELRKCNAQVPAPPPVPACYP